MFTLEFIQTKTRIFTRIIFVILFCFVCYKADSQEYTYRNFTSSDGLPQPYVYAILQDSSGYLWVCTGEGLSRYNGFVFRSFTVSDSLSENFVTSGYAEADRIWFGHRNGGISLFDGIRFRKIFTPWTESGPVTHFAKDTEENIWVSTLYKGIFRITDEKIDTNNTVMAEGLEVNSFEFYDVNSILIGSGAGLCAWISDGTNATSEISLLPAAGGTRISAIKRMKKGSGFLVASESDGVFKVETASSPFNIVKNISGQDIGFTSVQDVCEDSQGNIWLATFGSGLIKKENEKEGGNSVSIISGEPGFITNNVKVVFEDREGNIWSGNYGDGLTQINPRLFNMYSYDPVKYGRNIFSICSTGRFQWIGTESGLLKTEQFGTKIIKYYSSGSGLPKDTITSIYCGWDNILWIGTEKNGVYCLDISTDSFSKFNISDGSLENSVTSITGKDDIVWIGTKKGVCRITSSDRKIRWFSVSMGGLPHNYINSLFTDDEGKLWASTNSSILACIYGDKITRIPITTGTGILTLGPITQDRESRIWVGSKGNGIFIIGTDSIFYLSTRENLFSDYCYSIICDNNNYVWVGHKGGLSRIRTTDLTVKPVRSFDVIPGEYHLNPNAIAADSKQNIWIGSDRGLISYNQSMEIADLEPPELSITSLWVNDEVKEFSEKGVVLPPGKYKIRIEYIGVSLKEPHLVTYQHKLVGYDQWSDISKSTSVTYNQLGDGDYRFILKAASGDGIVTPSPFVFQLIIRKPLWKNWWFYVVSVLFIGLSVFWFLRIHFQRLHKEKRILEEKIQERVREIMIQRDEIEIQHNIIEEKNNNITSSIRYASTIQHAVLTPQEYIDTLLPENFILSIPRDIVSGDFYWVTKKDEKIVVVVADCTGHGVPGAFMSMLGITLLNEIVSTQGITRPDEIVTMLRERMIRSLQQNRTDKTTTDGMDIAVCVINRLSGILQYTGAFNDLVIVSMGKNSVLRADRISVSASIHDSGDYTLNELKYNTGDMIYLFSDGYMDQFGGDFAKKFLRAHFYTTLLEVSALPVSDQKKFLMEKLQGWMKDHGQTDDITVMGIRL